jgi:uncharacterized BrkB/YihY/UPF0761 family membrane protein
VSGRRTELWRARLEHRKADVLRLQEELEATRDSRPAVDIGLSIHERDRAVLANLLAGAVAFRMFLWAIPFALALVTLAGMVAIDSSGEGTGIFSHLAIGGEIAGSLRDVGRERWVSQAWALVIGLVGAMWASRGLLRALRITHSSIWGTGRAIPRPNPLRSGLALMGVVSGLLLAVGVAAGLRKELPLVGLVVTLGTFFVLMVAWLVISWHMPHPRGLPLRALVPGAVVVGAGVQLLHLLTVYVLIGQADRAESTYGAIGVAVTLLLWFFLLARLFVAGAVVNAVLWEHETAGKVGLRVLGWRLFGRRPGDRPRGPRAAAPGGGDAAA